MAKVLVVEDDVTVRTVLTHGLQRRGHAVGTAPTAMEGLRQALTEHPDLMVLDLGLPDLDGAELLRMLRAVSRLPVIVTTGRGDETEMIRLLNSGADDYVVKPYSTAQLEARIQAVLRRTRVTPADLTVVIGGLRIDPRSRQATLDGTPLDLSPREFDLLYYLAAHHDEVITKRELLSEIWQVPYGGADKTVDVHLSWLRHKLGETGRHPRYLHTVRGVGGTADRPSRAPAVVAVELATP